MKIQVFVYSILILFFFGCSTTPKVIIAGSGWNNIAIVDKKSRQIEWIHELPLNAESNSVIVSPDGNIAFSYKQGARLVNLDHNIIWDYPVTEKGECHSITNLENGGFLLAISGQPAFLIELDKYGQEQRKVPFDGITANLHGQFRQVIKSRSDTYLIPLLAGKKIIEINRQGTQINEYPVPYGPFSVLELKNSNLIVACGDGHCFLEIDRKTGKEVRRIKETDISENKLHYTAQISQTKNGHLLICNWNGHFKQGEKRPLPHLIELDKKKQIVWELTNDNHQIKKVSAAFYVEDSKIFKTALTTE